jgi:two-component system, OmpR family, response regulator
MDRKVLIVEDDPDIARLIGMHLKDVRCTSEIVTSGDRALATFGLGAFDLVILDLMLPGLDGLSVCREIRSQEGYVPILILTAKSTELDRVLGLEMGADDYLTKPFSIPELMARIKALFRRVDALTVKPDATPQDAVIEFEDLRIDLGRHRVTVGGQPIELTAREFDLLCHFARHPGQVYSRVQLLDHVWGYNHEGYEHTVNTHINRLRAKIEKDPSKPHYIQTVWGVGYRFRE